MIWIDRIEEHSFFAHPLGRSALVVDLGMRNGSFALRVAERYGAKVIGAEPVPGLPRLAGATSVSVDQVAVGGATGEATLYLNAQQDATLCAEMAEATAKTTAVPVLTLDEFFARHEVQAVDLMKVDVEGAENGLLQSASDGALLRISQLTIEYHEFLDPRQAPDIDATERRLAAAGFRRMKMSMDRTDVLYYRPAAVGVWGWRIPWLLLRFKYWRGVRRLVRRPFVRRSDPVV